MPTRTPDPDDPPLASTDAPLTDVAAAPAEALPTSDQHPGVPSHPGVPLAPPGIAGESDVRVHTPSSAAPQPSHGQVNDGLGELPGGYGDGRLVALVRDPETLYVYWDFSQPQVEQCFAGLGTARAMLKLWNARGADAELVREAEVQLESRGWYLRDLPSSIELRVELWAVGERGARLIRAARPVRLPPAAPSEQLEAFYLRVVFDQSLREGLSRTTPLHYGGAAPSEWDRRVHPRTHTDSSAARAASSPAGKLPWSMTHLVPDLDEDS